MLTVNNLKFVFRVRKQNGDDKKQTAVRRPSGVRRFRAAVVQNRNGGHGVYDGHNGRLYGAILLWTVHQALQRRWYDRCLWP